jgi:hypothetical protein
VSEKDSIELESALSGAIALLIHADCVSGHTITNSEVSDPAADFDDFAGGVGADDEGEFDPAEEHAAHV